MIPIWSDIIKEVGETVRQVIPDPQKQAEFQIRIAELADKADERADNLLQGQIDVNKIEAANPNIFVSGWRPYIGWTCGAALTYTWILAPIGKVLFHLSELPIINPTEIYPIVMAMLGIAGMRTYEKVKGVATAAVPQSTTGSTPGPKPNIISRWFK